MPAFFSEDDSQSNDSSDSDSSSSQSDDADQETYLLDEPLERTTGSAHANSAAQAPRSMQWAVRTTPSQRTAGGAPTSSSTPAGRLSLLSFYFQHSHYEEISRAHGAFSLGGEGFKEDKQWLICSGLHHQDSFNSPKCSHNIPCTFSPPTVLILSIKLLKTWTYFGHSDILIYFCNVGR